MAAGGSDHQPLVNSRHAEETETFFPNQAAQTNFVAHFARGSKTAFAKLASRMNCHPTSAHRKCRRTRISTM
jgi:hypothetical protein